MKAVTLSAPTVGWPYIAVVLGLLLALPGCATNFVEDKIFTPSKYLSGDFRYPDHIRDVEAAGQAADGTVNICIYGYPGNGQVHERAREYRLGFPTNPGQLAALPQAKNSRDSQRRSRQPATIPWRAMPAPRALIGCPAPGSAIPIFQITARVTVAPVSGYNGYYTEIGKIYPVGQGEAAGYGLEDAILSNERVRKDIRDRIMAHDASTGIYQIITRGYDSAFERSTVFYKHNATLSGTSRIIEIDVSGEIRNKRKIKPEWIPLMPIAAIFDIATLPVQFLWVVFKVSG